jgi:hypothetical protein
VWHAWERREKCTRFWWESPREGDHLEDLGVGGFHLQSKEFGFYRIPLLPSTHTIYYEE